MATIVPTSMTGSGSRAVTETTMTASDTFTFLPNTGQLLILRNGTGGSLSVNIDGDGVIPTNLAGAGQVSLQAGYFLAPMGAGVVRVIMLDSIFMYLQGTIAITGGTGMTAILLNH